MLDQVPVNIKNDNTEGGNRLLLSSEVQSGNEYVKINLEDVLSNKSIRLNVLLMHKIANLASPILGNLTLLMLSDNNKVLEDLYERVKLLLNDILSGKENIQYLDLFNFIRNGLIKYINSADIESYNRFLRSINLLEAEINRVNSRFDSTNIKHEDVEKDIISCIDILTNSYEGNGCNIYFDFESYRTGEFYIPSILIDLIIDYVHNGIKYSDKGKNINVKIEQTREHISIVVVDEGFGIDKNQLQNSYSYKKRLDVSEIKDGNGVGCALAAYVVNRLGGDIEVKSEVDVGTEVRITIPM